MSVNDNESHLLAEMRRMVGKEVRRLKKQETLSDSDLDRLDKLSSTLIRIVQTEKKLTDEDVGKARQMSTAALRRAAKMRGSPPEGVSE
jgi:L-aminopeptidase/D-esterase-like protein